MLRAQPTVWHVKPGGNGDGTSWTEAYDELQDALAIAQSGNEIWVAAGTYTPTERTDPSDPRSATFKLVHGVAIYGGFAGSESLRALCIGGANHLSQCFDVAGDSDCPGGHCQDVREFGTCDGGTSDGFRCWLQNSLQDDCGAGSACKNLTVLSGDLSGDDANCVFNAPGDVCDTLDANGDRPTSRAGCESAGGKWYPVTCNKIDDADRSDNAYHVLTADSTVGWALLDGFTITGGNADMKECRPPGVLTTLCQAQSECNIEQICGGTCFGGPNDGMDCDDTNPDCPSGVCFAPRTVGGGMFNERGNVTVRNSVFSMNHAEFRGAGVMHLDAAPGGPVTPITLEQVDFVANWNADNGAGLYAGEETRVTATRCNFVGNRSERCGAGACNRGAVGSYTDCGFLKNRAEAADELGGGGMFNASSSPLVANCEFFDNVAESGGGGGVWNQKDTESPNPVPSNPVFENCRFIENASNGSTALVGGGGAWNQDASEARFDGCEFRGNTSMKYGGAMWNEDDGTRPLVKACSFVNNSAAGAAGAVFAHADARPVIVRCVFVDNTALGVGFGGALNLHSGGSAEVHSSLFAGNDAGTNGGAIDADVGVDVKVTNSAFVGNTARNGGALAEDDHGLTVVNCTVADNEAETGGGLHDRGFTTSEVAIVNSIFWGNKDASGVTAQAQISGVDDDQVTYTIWNKKREDPDTNVMNEDPGFATLATGAWDVAPEYKPDIHKTVFTDTSKSWPVDQFKDEFLNPDTSQMRQSVVVSNGATTITVWGKFDNVDDDQENPDPAGASYRVRDYTTLSACSPAIDAGEDASIDGVSCASSGIQECIDAGLDDASVTCVNGVCRADVTGRQRAFDAGKCPDASVVDLGAYEHQSSIDPDTCVCRPEPSRFFAVNGAEIGSGTTKSVRIKFVDLPEFSEFNDEVRWIGQPAAYPHSPLTPQECTNCVPGQPCPDCFWAAELQCDPFEQDWSALPTVYVTGPGVVPRSKYEVEVFDNGVGQGSARQVETARFGDVVHKYAAPSGGGEPSFIDIGHVVSAFKQLEGAALKVRAMLRNRTKDDGSALDCNVSFIDIGYCVEGFKSLPYEKAGVRTGPLSCP